MLRVPRTLARRARGADTRPRAAAASESRRKAAVGIGRPAADALFAAAILRRAEALAALRSSLPAGAGRAVDGAASTGVIYVQIAHLSALPFTIAQENTMSHRVLALITLAAASLGAVAQPAAPATPAAGASTPRIDQRQAHQERRIDRGVASGQLTRREAHRLEHQQGAIDRAEGRARADGTVTARERARLTHMQDRASANIARQRHDGQQRPGAASAPTK